MLSKTNALPVLPLRQTATLLKTQFKACTSEAFLVSLNQQWVAISQDLSVGNGLQCKWDCRDRFVWNICSIFAGNRSEGNMVITETYLNTSAYSA